MIKGIISIRFILAVNPKSGKKQSLKILDLVKPVFDFSGAELSIVVTDYPSHARELAAGLELDDYDGFLVLGGDGTIHEVVNGILE